MANLDKKSVKKRIIPSNKIYDWQKAKQQWRNFCEIEPTVPIYFKAWYWDATCDDEDDWWVILIDNKEGEIEAAFPFVYSKRKGLYFIENPWQVAAAGIWIRNKEDSLLKDLQNIDNVTESIFSKVPYYDKLNIVFDTRFVWTWHPLYWRGFLCTPTYTMKISSLDNEDDKKSFTKRKRKELNYTEKRVKVTFDEVSIDDYWNLFIKSYTSRGREPQYNKEKFVKLIDAARQHNEVWICGIHDEEKLIAGNICFNDSERVYNQFGCYDIDNKLRAEQYAVYSSLKRTVAEGKVFDFEGSMISGVCEFNIGFSPEFETHYRIEKCSNKYILMDCMRRIFALIKSSIARKLGGV